MSDKRVPEILSHQESFRLEDAAKQLEDVSVEVSRYAQDEEGYKEIVYKLHTAKVVMGSIANSDAKSRSGCEFAAVQQLIDLGCEKVAAENALGITKVAAETEKPNKEDSYKMMERRLAKIAMDTKEDLQEKRNEAWESVEKNLAKAMEGLRKSATNFEDSHDQQIQEGVPFDTHLAAVISHVRQLADEIEDLANETKDLRIFRSSLSPKPKEEGRPKARPKTLNIPGQAGGPAGASRPETHVALLLFSLTM